MIKDKGKSSTGPRTRISTCRLAQMIVEANVDAYGESEQTTGWLTKLEEQLELPFETVVLGVRVSVVSIEERDGNQIAAVCKRGKDKLAVGLTDLPLPSPRPDGADWIDAYRVWRAGKG